MAGLDHRQLRALQQMFAQQAHKDDGLVSFRAGRLTLDEHTRMVTADKKRGKIKLLKDEQGLLKFQWFNRISNQKELDLTIFPSSAKWEKINECTDGRVYLLRMVGSNRKYFFWNQEPEEDKDDEYFTNINKLCNGESISSEKDKDKDKDKSATNTAAASNPYAAALAGLGGGNAQSQQDALTQMIMNQLTGGTGASTGGTGGGSGAAATGANNNVSGDVMAQMRDMLQQQQRQALEEMKREPDLEDILDPTANQEIIALLDDEKIIEQLSEHLPENMRTRQDIIDQLQSPQFQGALRRLQSAVNGPQMPTLLAQMGVSNSNQNAMGVTAFVNAIQPNNDKSEAEQKEKEKDKDKGDKEKEKAKESTDDDGDTSMASKEDKGDKGGDKDKNEDIDDIYK